MLYLLPLKAFKKKPKVRIVPHHQRANETLGMLNVGELDLGVWSLTIVPTWANYRPSRDYPRAAVCAKGHPFARVGSDQDLRRRRVRRGGATGAVLIER